MVFKGLGVQEDTQTPCWLRPCAAVCHNKYICALEPYWFGYCKNQMVSKIFLSLNVDVCWCWWNFIEKLAVHVLMCFLWFMHTTMHWSVNTQQGFCCTYHCCGSSMNQMVNKGYMSLNTDLCIEVDGISVRSWLCVYVFPVIYSHHMHWPVNTLCRGLLYIQLPYVLYQRITSPSKLIRTGIPQIPCHFPSILSLLSCIARSYHYA